MPYLKARLVSVLIALLFVCAVLSGSGFAQVSPTLSKSELKTLLTTAKTADDHQRLAAFYLDKAKRSDAASQRFAKQAQFLESQSKPGIPSAAAKSYRYSSRQYAEEAWEAEALAAEQERLAQAAQTKVK